MNYAGKFDNKLTFDGPGAHSDSHADSLTEFLGLHPHSVADVHVATATHAPADAIIVADPQLLFHGDFHRSGVDLILSNDDHELVLQNYFKGEKRVALSSPDGAHLTGDIISALTGYQQYAQADGSASVSHVIGHVSKLVGTATAIRNGVSIILNNGDNVEKGDVVESGSGSTLGITFIDGTVFGLSSNAKMVLNEMVYDPNGSSNSSLISLVAGTISFVAGETAKHGDMKVDTPVATMGIRGTAVLVEIDFSVPGQGGAPSAQFQVLVEPDGTTGSYILFDKTTLAPLWTVNQAGQAISVNNGNVSVGTAQLSAEIQKLITDVFAQKYTSTDTNTKTADNHTDTLTPQTQAPIKTADGTTATAITLNVNTTGGPNQPGQSGPLDPHSHIPGPPILVIANPSGVPATSFATTERAATTGDSTHFDTAFGTVSFVDVNAGDTPTVSTKFDSYAYHGNSASALTALQIADIQAVEVNLVVVPAPGNNNNGSANWTYSVPDNAFDFLAAGETLTLTYTARVDNNYAPHNEFATQTFTITITGANDAPTITTTSAVLTEHSSIPDHASGTITFADVDLTDRPVVTTAFGSFTYRDAHGNDIPLTPELQAEIVAVESALQLTPNAGNINNGSVTWSYDVDDSKLAFLADGDTLTLTYTATVDDGHGGLTSKPITVTILGVSDVPFPITELPGQTGDTTHFDTASGTLTFTGVDLNNIHSATSNLFSATWSGGSELPSGLVSTLESSLAPSVTSSVGFKFSATDNTFDFLAAGETLTLIYDVTVIDDHGVSSTRPVTIIITGTNDTPTIAATSSAFAELSNPSQPNPVGSPTLDTASGTISFSDVDLTDRPVASASFTSFSYTDSGHHPLTLTTQQQADILAVEVPLTVTQTPGNTDNGSASWTYSLADSNFDFLAAGDILTLTYTATVDDGHGGVITEPFTVTVTGTNDTPVITSSAQTGTIAERSNDSQPNPTGSSTPDTASGAVTFTDVDLSDHHTVTVTGVATLGTTSGLPSTTTMLSWFSLGGLTDTTGTGIGGSDAWSFSAQDKSFDYLAAGETVTLTYTVQVDDGHGGVVTQPVTITVTGTNDTPVITSSAQIGTIAERSNDSQPNPTGSSTPDTASGAVTFTDVDLSDHHTVAVTGVATLGTISGLPSTATMLTWFSLGGLTDTTGTGIGGSDAWSFSAQDKSFDYLAAGETVTLTYTVQVDDGHGGVVSQPVTITVTGTNDTPVITSSAQTGTIAERSNSSQPNPTGSTLPDTASGSVTFTDVDLSDHHTVAVTGVATLGTTSGLPSTTTMLTWLSLGPLTDTTGTGIGGSDAWSFSAQDKSFDYLAAGETVTLTYAVQVNDGHGGVVSQPVTITVTGTNDTPAITSSAQIGTIAERSNDSQPNPTGSSTPDTASGAVTFTDVDLSDHHTVTVTGVATLGTTSGLPSTATMLTWFSLGGLTDTTGTGTGGSDAWSFSAQDKSFDYLAAGETVTLTYTVQVADGHGGVVSQPVTITVTGTNDTPVITSSAQTGTIAERSNSSQPNPTGSSMPDTASGAVTFTDVDLSDHHTVTVTGVATLGTTSGLPSTTTMLSWFSLGGLTDTTGTGIGGSDAWSFSAQDKSFDYLAAGETVTLTYAVQVNDGHGGIVSQPVTITVTGTNDTPAITSSAQIGTIAEIAGALNSTTADTASGAVTFTDVDLSDHHTVTVTGVSASGDTLGLSSNLATLQSWLSLGPLTDTMGTGTGGSDAWTFSAQDKNFDYLAAGQTLTLTYTVQVNDGHGGVVSQPVTITVTGTNDAPVIVGETDPTTQTVILARSPVVLAHGVNTNSLGLDTETFDDRPLGSRSFFSSDLDATFTASGNAGVVHGTSSGSTAPFVGTGHADTTNYLGIGGDGTETITFAEEENAFGLYWGSVDAYNTINFYNGTTLVASYTGADISPLLANGDQASFASNGYVEFSDLAPFNKVVLASSANAFEVDNVSAGFISDSHIQLASPITGTLTISDADIGDTLTASVIGNAVVKYDGSTTLPSDANVAALIDSSAVKFDSVTTTGGLDVLHWTYNPANLDFLEPGDTLTVTFQAQVSDGHAVTADQSLTVTIVGTGASVVNGTAQNDTFVNVGGGVTIFGHGGQDTFVFKPNFGSATIADFDATKDTIDIDHTLFNSVSALLASAQVANSGHDIIITDAAHDTITLKNVNMTLAQLATHQSDFHIT